MLRFLEKHNIKSSYIPEVLVKMRTGGHSSPSVINTLRTNIKCYKVCKKNGLNPGLGLILKKSLSKLGQFFKRRVD